MIPTQILRVVKGIPKLPGDNNSAEPQLTTFALHMENGQSQGFSLDPSRPWQPERAVVKSQQWIDSNRKDGRTLDGNAVSNVRETINITASAGDHLELVQRIAALQRLASDAQLFHASFYQIDPVYLEWAMSGGKGSQYALIYDIEISVTTHESASGGALASLVLVIEREPAWRGIPPGANSKLWTYYWRGLVVQQYPEFDILDKTLPPLISGVVTNANEFEASVDSYLYPSRAVNYIDIPAEDIPGDAPALVQIHIYDSDEDEDGNYANLHISRSTKPQTLTTRSGNTRRRIYALPVADATTFSSVTATAKTQGVRRSSDGARYVGRLAGSGTGFVEFGEDPRELSTQNLRGKFNVYVRAEWVSAVSSGSITYTLTVRPGDSAMSGLTLTSTVPADSTQGTWHYIGVVDLPAQANSRIRYDGRGLDNIEDEELIIRLQGQNLAAVSCDWYDLIFVPFDEPSLVLSNLLTPPHVIYDSTGYYSHGEIKDVVSSVREVNSPNGYFIDRFPGYIRGDELTLSPGKYNSLVFWFEANPASASNPTIDYDVELDIVPRWYGVRDA